MDRLLRTMYQSSEVHLVPPSNDLSFLGLEFDINPKYQ